MAQLGGYGEKLYLFISVHFELEKSDFDLIWNTKIFPHREQRDIFNGVEQKISFQEKLHSQLHSSLADEDLMVRVTEIFLLLSCLDAISGDRFLPFVRWLKEEYPEEKDYRLKDLTKLEERYFKEFGGRTLFKKLFENLVSMNILERYDLSFSPKSKDFLDMNPEERKILMDSLREKKDDMSDIEKAHQVGLFFYEFYRNLFVHAGRNYLHDVSEQALIAFGLQRDKETWTLPLLPEINLLGGTITGDVIDDIKELLRIALAKKIEKLRLY